MECENCCVPRSAQTMKTSHSYSLILFPSSGGLDGNENDSLRGHELKMTVFVSLLAWIIFRKVVSVAQKYQLWATIWQRGVELLTHLYHYTFHFRFITADSVCYVHVGIQNTWWLTVSSDVGGGDTFFLTTTLVLLSVGTALFLNIHVSNNSIFFGQS